MECQRSTATGAHGLLTAAMISYCMEKFHNALDYALERLEKSELSLKEAQYEFIKNLVCNCDDTIRILSTDFGKFLIYQMLPFVLNYFHSKTEASSIIVKLTGNGTVFKQPIKYAIFRFDQSFSSRPRVKESMTLGTRLEVR